MHGAHHQNSFFMTPGSSVVEVMPHEWDKDWFWGDALGRFNAEDPSTQLLWWSIAMCDPQDSEPGAAELAKAPDTGHYARDR